MNYVEWDQLAIKPNEVDILVYHDNCIDGFGCVISAEYYLRVHNSEQKIIYVAASYDKELEVDVANKNVIFCDFSYKKNKMDEIKMKAKNILILDHHKSAVAELEHLDKCYKVLDMNQSGAYITWSYFNGHYDIPLLIKYIQDNDLWIKKMEYTNEIYAYLNSLEKHIPNFYVLLDDGSLLKKIDIGMLILKKENEDMNALLNNSIVKPINIKNKTYMVAMLECSIYKYKSELGNRMLLLHNLCDFAMIYNYEEVNDKTYISLRSNNFKTDVSEIAALYGGGGHRNASGISLDGKNTDVLPCIN